MTSQPTLSPQAFVAKWRLAQTRENASYAEHFIDLCRLVGHPTPIEADPDGTHFAFQAGAVKQSGGQGWADVWKKGHFALEYKGKHANLDKAYQQILQYREALQNPPLLIVCDLEQLIIHTNFTNTVKQITTLTFDALLTATGMQRLRDVFYAPDAFRAPQTTEQVTRQAAEDFAHLADLLRKWGEEPHRIAHFLIRLLFCLFAEDVGLLPPKLFSRLIAQTRTRPPDFAKRLALLFDAMAHGGSFGVDDILHFNGRLFDDAAVLELDSQGLDILHKVSLLDWSSIEPSILGTLFERSLDPGKRAQLGAHYTSREDILLIVEPVLMLPLRRRWEAIRDQVSRIRDQASGIRDQASGIRDQDQAPTPDPRPLTPAARRHVQQGIRDQDQTSTPDPRPLTPAARRRVQQLLQGFAHEIASTRVLDPSCGSANFLYVALKQLLDLEKEVITFAGDLGVGTFFPSVSPEQLRGIEVNEYAHELASVTVWIGYIQWLRDNGFGAPSEPILKPLDTIQRMDAVLQFDANGTPVEPAWPQADVIVGNPPFLGGKRLRAELGDEYVNTLFALYDKRVPREADLVTYWFERARALIERGEVKRAGLLATQGIRGGANRKVLERIKQTGDIFLGWSDREWILDGAAVHVSLIGFDNSNEQQRTLDGQSVTVINPNLTTNLNLTTAQRLAENANLAFMGDTKGGTFDIPADVAVKLINAPLNPNGRPNTDVVRPWVNGLDVTRRPRGMWIIDFGVNMSEEDAALYEAPFAYVQQHVKPERIKNNRAAYRDRWWIHMEARPDLRAAIKPMYRYIITPRVSKHRLFAWMKSDTLPDSATIAITRDDDYFFGVLHSHIHELWARGMGTQLREVESGFRYTPTTTFETFPFPFPPGSEPADDPRVAAIAAVARRLVELRDNWLNPQGSGIRDQGSGVRGQGLGADEQGSRVMGQGLGADERGLGVPSQGLGADGQGSGVNHQESGSTIADSEPLTPDPRPLTPDPRRTLTNLYNARPAWLEMAHKKLDAAVCAAYGWPHELQDAEILTRLLALNAERAT